MRIPCIGFDMSQLLFPNESGSVFLSVHWFYKGSGREMREAKSAVGFILVSLGAAVAHADLMTTINDASFTSRYRELVDGEPRIDDNLILSGADVIGAGVQEYSFDRSADPSLYPSVNAFGGRHSFRTEVSNTRFAVEWDFGSNADLTRSLGSGENLRANMQFVINAGIQIAAGTEYRLSWSGAAGSFLGDSPSLINSAFMSVGGDVVNPFTLGFGNSTPPTIPGDTSFTAVAAADGSFDLILEAIFVNSASAAGPATNWDQFSRGSFAIEVVPTPGSAAMLGAAGVLATRRRRR